MRMAVLQGPDCGDRLRGWSHFLLCVGTKPPAPYVAMTINAAARAAKMGARYFPRGTWESDVPPLTNAYHKPSAVVSAWLEGREQESMPV